MTGKKARREVRRGDRKGDHICYVSDMTKFRSHFPGWSITKSLNQIYAKLVESSRPRFEKHRNPR